MAKRKRITKKLVQATENLPVKDLPKVAIRPEVDDDDQVDDGLTIRQRLFVEALAGPARGNATKAAEMAGYNASNRNSLCATASENLRKPMIQRALAHALAKLSASPEWAINQAFYNARVSMADFLVVGDDGQPVFDWKKAAASGAIGQIREYKEDGIVTGDDEGPAVIKRSFKLIDSQKALDTVLKLHGVLVDKSEVKVKADVAHSISEPMKKLMGDPVAFEAATQLADRLKALEPSPEPSRN